MSGGSFTAAYYGLFGERIFEDFEEKLNEMGIREISKDLRHEIRQKYKKYKKSKKKRKNLEF